MSDEYDVLIEISADDVKKVTEERDNRDAEITRLREENARLAALSAKASLEASQLREVLQECADDLEDVINGQYGEIGKKAMPDRYERDMQPVIRARAAIREGGREK